MTEVRIRDVRKAYGSVEVIHGMDFTIPDGEFVVLVGPSGCGKSTLLRMIAGLESITSGTIAIGERVVNNVPPAGRDIAMVFQNYALYPHKTVRSNMAFALRMRRMQKAEVDRRVTQAAEVLGLTPYLDRYPRSLSGGQRQRVAMGRAIVRDPEVFLFDEPLSNLDAALRIRMRLEIARLHQRLHATMIYVTHDQTEAMTLADRIAVVNAGTVEQLGSPMELYERPANLFVAGFIGAPSMNFIPFAPEGAGEGPGLAPGGLGVQVGSGAEDATTLGIRPEHLLAVDTEEGDFSARVEIVEDLGAESLVYLQPRFKDESLTMRVNAGAGLAPGNTIGVRVDRDCIHYFGRDGRAIR